MCCITAFKTNLLTALTRLNTSGWISTHSLFTALILYVRDYWRRAESYLRVSQKFQILPECDHFIVVVIIHNISDLFVSYAVALVRAHYVIHLLPHNPILQITFDAGSMLIIDRYLQNL
jgi:hypothetical protein